MTRSARKFSPTLLVLTVVVLGCATAVAGVYLLAGLAVSLIVGGVVLAAGGLVVDV